MTTLPPAYSDVFVELKNELGSNPTSQKVLEVVFKLPETKRDVILTQSPPLEPAYIAEFRIAVAQQMSQCQKELRVAGDETAKACKAIDEMFKKLATELVKIDQMHEPPPEGAFGPRLEKIRATYQKAILESARTAMSISVYAARFDDVLLDVVKDTNLSQEQKLKKVDEYIHDAENIATTCKAVEDKFDAISNDLAAFVKTFSGWAIAKEKLAADELKSLEDQAKELWNDYESLAGHRKRAGWLSIGCIFGFMFAMICGPIGVLVGLGIALVGLGSGIAFMCFQAAASNKYDAWQAKMAEVQKAKADVSKIQNQRMQLEALGVSSVGIFDKNIQVLKKTWECAKTDAEKIKKYLENGEKQIDKPEYMMLDFGNAGGVYKALSMYMHSYADAIGAGSIPSHPPPAYTQK